MPEKTLTKNVAKLGRIFAALNIKIGELSFLGFFSSLSALTDDETYVPDTA
jgi:hypothetical protein